MRTDLTQKDLRKALRYDPKTGSFQWLARRDGRQKDKVGCFSRKRHYICIDGQPYLAHRLAWLYMTGKWPVADIDHIDNDSLNNRFENLREASRAQNLQNTRKPRRKNAGGLIGATRFGSRWRARIGVNYKTIKIGVFDTAQEAHAAYVKAKRQLHEFGML